MAKKKFKLGIGFKSHQEALDYFNEMKGQISVSISIETEGGVSSIVFEGDEKSVDEFDLVIAKNKGEFK